MSYIEGKRVSGRPKHLGKCTGALSLVLILHKSPQNVISSFCGFEAIELVYGSTSSS